MDSVRIDRFVYAVDLVEENFQSGLFPYLIRDLKLELRQLKTFLLCARMWSDYVPSGSDSSSNSFFSRLIDAVNEKEEQFFSYYFVSQEDPYMGYKLVKSSKETIQRFKQEISEWYCTLSRCCSFRSPKDQLMEFIDSVLLNMDYLLYLIPTSDGILLDQIEVLIEKLWFFKNFIHFAELRGFEDGQLEDLLCQIQNVASWAARVSHTIGVDYNNEPAEERDVRKHLIDEVLTLIDDPSIHETNIQILSASNLLRSSRAPSLETDKHILGNFVESLIFYVWKALTRGTNCMVSSEDHMPMLYEGLRFLRNIFKKHLEKVDELHEIVKDLIGAAVNEAGIVIFSVLADKLKEGLAKEAFFDFMEKIKLIKVLTSTFIFSRTDELGFMDFFLKNLNALPSCKVDSIAFAKDQIQTVQEDLVALRFFMEKIMYQRNQHKNLQALWDRVLEVTYSSQYIIQSLVVGDITDSSPMIFNSITKEINLIKMEALKIGDNEYCSEARKASRTSKPLPSQNSIPTIKKDEVILYDEAKAIMDQVIGGLKRLEIVSIVGMPGLGKTTLARNIYNDSSVRELFHIHAWGVVSQAYRKKVLLLQILDCIVPNLSDQYSDMSESNLEEELRKRLLGNRYLIVLDDVWDSEAWSDLERSFPNDVNESRILLTSRHINMAKKINPNSEPHALRLLTEDESWELLQKNLSCKEGYDFEFGRQIAKNCKGLPLTVVIVAGLLANLHQDSWEEIAERLSLNTLSASEDCMDMFDMSYGYLPDYLKSCLLCFGSFQEDEDISLAKLTRLWIAERFVQESETKSLEDVAKDYMNDLIGRNWVMVSKERSMRGVKTCRIHDLLHEFCLIKCKKENFLCLSSYDELVTSNFQSDLQRLCVKVDPEQFERSMLFCPSVRSLQFFAHDYEHDIVEHRILSIFRIFKLLQVLDLGKYSMGISFPSELCLLVELKFLAIRGFFKHIPASVSNLANLEFLILDARHYDVLLPITIWNIQKLRHLKVIGSSADFSLAKDNIEMSSDLQNLHTCSSLLVDAGPSLEKILKMLPNIHRLSCKLSSSRETTADWNGIVRMDFLSRLKSLRLQLSLEEELYHIEFHFPLNLRKLSLINVHSSVIPKIGQLANLEVLKLCNMYYEEGNWDMEEGFEFPELKLLKLRGSGIVNWIGSGDHFPRLQKLVLEDCIQLELVPSCLGEISTLETIEAHWCSSSAQSLLRNIEEEQNSWGNEDFKLHIIP